MRPQYIPLIPWFFFVLLVACGSGPADESVGTPTPEPTPADASAIRGVDFEQVSGTQTLLQQLGGGRVASEAVIFADLTGDQREEAVVPVTSDGTLGNVAYLVMAMQSGTPSVILTRTGDRTTAGGLVMSVTDGQLLETVGVFGPSDPLCCPSQLRKTTFRWDGDELQVEREETQKQAPSAKR